MIGSFDPSAPAVTRWVPGHRAAEARLRLFCLPYSGAGAAVYRPWRGALGADVDVCPVQLPGRENRIAERPHRRMQDLVPALAAGLAPLLDRPFALFGHSLGALVAFELARHLRRERGPRPVHLFVSGHPAPQAAAREEPMHDLPEPELVERLRQLGGTPEEVLRDRELRELLLPVVRADFEVCETYALAPEPPLEVPLTAIGGDADDDATRDRLEPWAAHTTGRFEVHVLPGDHFFLVPQRLAVLRILGARLRVAPVPG